MTGSKDSLVSEATTAVVAGVPTCFPASFSLRNVDAQHADVLFLLDDRPVIQLKMKPDQGEEFASQADLVFSARGEVPYTIRRHVPSSTYEVVSVAQDGSSARCRKLTTQTKLFKTKYVIPGPGPGEGEGEGEWAWKGSLNRTLSLYAYPAKTLLAEFVRSASGPAGLHLTADLSPENLGLVIASLYPLIDMHRIDLATNYTTDERLVQLQRQVKPAAWDSAFLTGLGTAKQEKFKFQLAKERERERSSSRNRDSPNGFIPVNHDDRRSRDNSPARFERPRTAGSRQASDHGDEAPRGRQ